MHIGAVPALGWVTQIIDTVSAYSSAVPTASGFTTYYSNWKLCRYMQVFPILFKNIIPDKVQ